jgi:tetratricopeptide (TPR) repeat protein
LIPYSMVGEGPSILGPCNVPESCRCRTGKLHIWPLFSFFLCLTSLPYRSSEAFGDYEFHRIQAAQELRGEVLEFSQEMKGLGKEGKESGLKEKAEKAIALRKSSLMNNPFYHLIAGEIYSRGNENENEKAAGEWNKARALAGEDVFLHWLLVKELCQNGRHEEVKTGIQEILRAFERTGPQRLPFLASESLRLAEQLRGRHLPRLAFDLTDLALSLDPRSPEPHFLRASLIWQEEKWGMKRISREMVSGSLKMVREDMGLRSLSANILSASVWTYFILLLMFGMVLFVKYESLVRHELMENLKIYLSLRIGSLLLCLFYLIPLFLFLGWIWLAFFWIFLIFPFCMWKEKAALTLLIVVLCALPLFYRYSACLQIARDDPWTRAAMEIEDGRAGEGASSFLTQFAASHPEDPFSHFYLGLLFKGNGEWNQAEKEFQVCLQRLPDWAIAHNNLGNIYFVQKRYDEAEEEYKAAIEDNPDAASTHANLGLLYGFYPRRLRLEESRSEFEKAEKLDPGITPRMESLELALIGRYLFYQGLPREEFWGRIRSSSRESGLLAESLWGERIRFLSLDSLVYFPLLLLSLVWISWGVRGRGPNPRFCLGCGKEFCKLCEGGSARGALCGSCEAILHSREAVSPQARTKRLIEKERREEKRRAWVRILSLLPGATCFYLGKVGPGLTLSTAFFFLLFLWTGWSEIVPTADPFSRYFPLTKATIFLASLLLLYGSSIRRGLRWSS